MFRKIHKFKKKKNLSPPDINFMKTSEHLALSTEWWPVHILWELLWKAVEPQLYSKSSCHKICFVGGRFSATMMCCAADAGIPGNCSTKGPQLPLPEHAGWVRGWFCRGVKKITEEWSYRLIWNPCAGVCSLKKMSLGLHILEKLATVV